MIEFRRQEGFEKEIAALERRRFRSLSDSIHKFQNVCAVHFHPATPERLINPGKLHRVTQNDSWILWKTELPLVKSGLRQNQYPRLWFVVKGSIIAFLCISSHIENYNDKEMSQLALSRVSDFF